MYIPSEMPLACLNFTCFKDQHFWVCAFLVCFDSAKFNKSPKQSTYNYRLLTTSCSTHKFKLNSIHVELAPCIALYAGVRHVP